MHENGSKNYIRHTIFLSRNFDGRSMMGVISSSRYLSRKYVDLCKLYFVKVVGFKANFDGKLYSFFITYQRSPPTTSSTHFQHITTQSLLSTFHFLKNFIYFSNLILSLCIYFLLSFKPDLSYPIYTPVTVIIFFFFSMFQIFCGDDFP